MSFDPLPPIPSASGRAVAANVRLRNLWGRNWIDSPRIPLLIAGAVFLFGLQVWRGADWSPILFTVFRPQRFTGTVMSAEISTRLPSDGRVWEVHFEYPGSAGATREAVSWAPTTDSKRGVFWRPFSRPLVGTTVDVDEIPGLNLARIEGMRTGWLSLDGALWLIAVECFLIGLAVVTGVRMWRGNRLLESATLGRAILESVEVMRGRGRYYRMNYRLLDVDGVTFKVSTARREGFAAEGHWEWCLYEPNRPRQAVLLTEFADLPPWARAVRDAPRA